MELQEQIEKNRAEIHTDSYSMSLGEWISLYEKGEVDIHPEFQRFFRWTNMQKTRLIESILLGIPIPPIFVSQRSDGAWDVVDGLQRLATIYQFVGILKDEEGNFVPPLVLNETKYLPSLKDKKWEEPDDPDNSFSTTQRLYLKRSRLDVNIILEQSDEATKYELFQRLNRGGSLLSDQELRNCILVQLNREMFNWMQELAKYDNFQECTALTERAREEQYDLELVLRFLVFRKLHEDELSNIGDLGEFLTDKMVGMAQSRQFDYAKEAKAFRQTFDILKEAGEDDSFRRYDMDKRKYAGGFLVHLFEVFALGIGYHHSRLRGRQAEVKERMTKFWKMERRELRAGSGVRASTRIPTTIPFGRRLFDA